MLGQFQESRCNQTDFVQYEVVTGPLPPLEAADVLVHTRETIYNIAHKHGLRATLAPRCRWDRSTRTHLRTESDRVSPFPGLVYKAPSHQSGSPIPRRSPRTLTCGISINIAPSTVIL